jgi:FixJ family two-component response regulator
MSFTYSNDSERDAQLRAKAEQARAKSARLQAKSAHLTAQSEHVRAQSDKLKAESTESLAHLEALEQEAKSLRDPRLVPGPVIHIVDDDPQLVTAMSRLLRAMNYVVRSYTCVGEFLSNEIPDAPGCLLLDVYLPDVNGLDLQRLLRTQESCLPIIFITGRADVSVSVQAMKGGAIDFLVKPIPREILLPVVQNAVARSIKDRSVREQLAELRARYETLTKREAEVFELVVAGKLTKQIAHELGAAERTIKFHRHQIMQKMHVVSVAELTHLADQVLSRRPSGPGASPGN